MSYDGRLMTDASEPLARTERLDTVGELIINRPERRNALTSETITALHEGLDALIADPEVKAILIRGEGDSFTSGMDVSKEIATDRLDRWRRFHAAIYACPKPIVGALQRYAIAGGSALAFACDFLIVGETARIDTSEVRIGMAATMNVVWLQLKWGIRVGYRFALAGQPILGPELVTLGVATKSVPDDEVLDEARAYAAMLTEYDAWAMGSVKSALQNQQGTTGSEGFESLVLAAQAAQLPRP